MKVRFVFKGGGGSGNFGHSGRPGKVGGSSGGGSGAGSARDAYIGDNPQRQWMNDVGGGGGGGSAAAKPVNYKRNAGEIRGAIRSSAPNTWAGRDTIMRISNKVLGYDHVSLDIETAKRLKKEVLAESDKVLHDSYESVKRYLY